MATVTKKELAYRIAEKCGQKKVVVKRIIQEFITEIIEELAAGNRLEFREFGVFEMKTRAARKARNPRTGVRVDVPSKAVVHFKAGRAMKERVQRAADAGRIPATPLRDRSRQRAGVTAGVTAGAVGARGATGSPARDVIGTEDSSVAADL